MKKNSKHASHDGLPVWHKQASADGGREVRVLTIGNLSKDVFERRTSTGSEAFSLLICLDANKFVLLSFFSLIKMIYQRVSTEPLPNDAKSPLQVEVRRSKTLLLKLPILYVLARKRSLRRLILCGWTRFLWHRVARDKEFQWRNCFCARKRLTWSKRTIRTSKFFATRNALSFYC